MNLPRRNSPLALRSASNAAMALRQQPRLTALQPLNPLVLADEWHRRELQAPSAGVPSLTLHRIRLKGHSLTTIQEHIDGKHPR